MATVHKETILATPADTVWESVADFGAVNKLVTYIGDVRVQDDHRFCSIDGGETEEVLITSDPGARRLVYALRTSPFNLSHHQSTMQVFPEGSGSRLTWTTDFKPDEASPMMEQAYEAAIASVREVLG